MKKGAKVGKIIDQIKYMILKSGLLKTGINQ